MCVSAPSLVDLKELNTISKRRRRSCAVRKVRGRSHNVITPAARNSSSRKPLLSGLVDRSPEVVFV
jgi:hypothetical protein